MWWLGAGPWQQPKGNAIKRRQLVLFGLMMTASLGFIYYYYLSFSSALYSISSSYSSSFFSSFFPFYFDTVVLGNDSQDIALQRRGQRSVSIKNALPFFFYFLPFLQTFIFFWICSSDLIGIVTNSTPGAARWQRPLNFPHLREPYHLSKKNSRGGSPNGGFRI